MTNQDIKKIFNFPQKDVVLLLLNKVNLKAKEKEVINLCMEGYTEEYSAECLGISRNGFQKIKKKAYEKIKMVWENDKVAQCLLLLYE